MDIFWGEIVVWITTFWREDDSSPCSVPPDENHDDKSGHDRAERSCQSVLVFL